MKGKLLAIDYGAVRIGLATCDPDHIVVSPLETYNRTDPTRDQAYLLKVFSEEKPVRLVVGMPVHLNGMEGQKAKEVRAFVEWLRGFTPLPIAFADERFSSHEADQLMGQRKLTNKKRKERRDGLAAMVILQGYMEAGCPEDTVFRAIDH